MERLFILSLRYRFFTLVAVTLVIALGLWSLIHLTIDANQSYSAKNAIIAINRMADFKIDLVEQPVPADDFEGLSLVTPTVPVTVQADGPAGPPAESTHPVPPRAASPCLPVARPCWDLLVGPPDPPAGAGEVGLLQPRRLNRSWRGLRVTDDR